MNKKNTEKLFVEIDEQLKKDLKEKALNSRKTTSVSQVVRDILTGYFDRQRKKK